MSISYTRRLVLSPLPPGVVRGTQLYITTSLCTHFQRSFTPANIFPFLRFLLSLHRPTSLDCLLARPRGTVGPSHTCLLPPHSPSVSRSCSLLRRPLLSLFPTFDYRHIILSSLPFRLVQRRVSQRFAPAQPHNRQCITILPARTHYHRHSSIYLPLPVVCSVKHRKLPRPQHVLHPLTCYGLFLSDLD